MPLMSHGTCKQWLFNINCDKYTGVIFADFSKAYDVINHALLLSKLKLYGLSLNIIKLIESFISDRQQSVCVGVSLSINASCELFADDISIHTIHNSLQILSSTQQESMYQVVSWAEYNHMSLNPEKSKYMSLTTRQKNVHSMSHFQTTGSNRRRKTT